LLIKYERRQPEHTLLYKIIKEYYPAFISHLEAEERKLPEYVRNEFEEYLKCGLLSNGFLRIRCEGCQHERLVAFSCKKRGFCPSCGAKRMIESSALLIDSILPHQPMRQWVLSIPFALRLLFASHPHVLTKSLSIIYRTIASYLIKQAGFTHKTARTGAVTLIQRFGSALNLNIHFHMLFLDGVYIDDERCGQLFLPVNLRKTDIVNLTYKISLRLARYLERAGLINSDEENSYLADDALNNTEIHECRARSINYQISIGIQKGKKVFSLQTLPPCIGETYDEALGKVAGFSLHAGVSVNANERDKLERLCRYMARPAVSVKRLSLTPQGNIRYELKTPYRNGTTHMIFEPLDFVSKLAALVPVPRVHLTRFHGVFAPNSKHRASVTYCENKIKTKEEEVRTAAETRGAMSWAKRLKRAFSIDINTCEACGGAVKIIACIDDPLIIKKILINVAGPSNQVPLPHTVRAPPVTYL
jgi:ribosomal protein S27E